MAGKKKPKIKHHAKKIPRQQLIPGVGDAKIIAIENTAYDYAELLDERLQLLKREVELKKRLIDLMHKKEITQYRRNGISIKLVIEKEGVRVRVRESEDDLPADIGPAPEAQVTPESVVVNSES